MSTPTTPKRDWKQIVEAHAGQMFFLPQALIEKAKAWQSSRMAFQKKANELAKEEANIGMMFNDLIHAIRGHFEEAGAPENIWMCDIGFNTEALKEGEFIVNIQKAERAG